PTDEDHDLPAAGRPLRPRPPRRDRRRGHPGPGRAPQGGRQGRRRDPPPGPSGDEVPLAAPQAVARLVQRREGGFRSTAGGLTRAVGRRRRGGATGTGAPLACGSRHGRGPTWVPPPRNAISARPAPPPAALGVAPVRCAPVRDGELHATASAVGSLLFASIAGIYTTIVPVKPGSVPRRATVLWAGTWWVACADRRRFYAAQWPGTRSA